MIRRRHLLIATALMLLAGAGWHIRDHQLDSRFFHANRLQEAQPLAPGSVRAGLWLFDYHVELEAKPVAGIDNNFSGLAWDGDRDLLWAVTNSPTRLFALDRDGNVERRIELDGFHDVEAVAYLGGGRLAMTEERRGTIVFVTVPPAGVDRIARAGALAWQVGEGSQENSGFEGLDYDPVGDRLLVVKERDPRRLFALANVTEALARKTVPMVMPLSAWLTGDIFARDLSSVVVDPRSGNLLLLSDESQVVLALAATGELNSFKSLLRGRAGLSRAVPQAEGLAMDEEGTLFVASEPNLFYRFRSTEAWRRSQISGRSSQTSWGSPQASWGLFQTSWGPSQTTWRPGASATRLRPAALAR